MDQSEAPYVDALAAYVARDAGRFHVPGHKGEGVYPQLIAALGAEALLHDVPSGIHGIDAGEEPTPFARAQALAAAAWGAERSWFLLNGASGGNHAICMALAHAGERVVVQRNIHSSTVDGLVLSGLRPSFVQPEIDPELGIAHCVMPQALDEALSREPDAVAALVVSPTYFGASTSTRSCRRVRSATAPTSSSPALTRSSAASPSRRSSTSAQASESTPRSSIARSPWSSRPAPTRC